MRDFLQTLTITAAAILATMVVFGVFIWFYNGTSPMEMYELMYVGGYGSKFSIMNTLTRAAPLILTALCTALPMRVGMTVIGGEGALVLGGLAAASAGLLLADAPPAAGQLGMLLAGFLAGGAWIGLVGLLRYLRGVNETISSLLMVYIAIGVFTFLVEGPMRDPESLNKPSTYPIPEAFMIDKFMGFEVHWGLPVGIVFCIVSYLLMYHTTFGFAASMVGGNMRAAQGSGLPVGFVMVLTCFLAGGAAGIAGMVEIGAVHRQAHASLIAGYGYTGILVSFIARHHPLAIMPVAVLFGGLSASAGLIQRRLHLPDASILMFSGILFVMIAAFETLYGRSRLFLPPQPKEVPAT